MHAPETQSTSIGSRRSSRATRFRLVQTFDGHTRVSQLVRPAKPVVTLGNGCGCLNGAVGLPHETSRHGHLRVLLEPRRERMRDVAVDAAIGVQQKEILAGRHSGAAIHAGGESGIGVHGDELHPWESSSELRGGNRIAGVIDDDHFDVVSQKRTEGVEAGCELFVGAIVDDDD